MRTYFLIWLLPTFLFSQSTPTERSDKVLDRLSVEVQTGFEPVSYVDLHTVSFQNYMNIRFERFIRWAKVETTLQMTSTHTYVFVRGGVGFTHNDWNFWAYPIGMRAKIGRGNSTPPSLEIGRKHFSFNVWMFRDKFIPSVIVKVPLTGRFSKSKAKSK